MKTVSLETMGPDGRYIPYSESDKESNITEDGTVRTIERTFGRGPDGQRVLIQQEEDEICRSSGLRETVLRKIWDPDVNAYLQLVQIEFQESRQISADIRDTDRTVSLPDINGGLSPKFETHERERLHDDGRVESRKSTFLSDGAGHWELVEVRETKADLVRQQQQEELVLRPDSNGKLALVQRTVSDHGPAPDGGKRESVSTYSATSPGVAGNAGLRLIQNQTTVVRTAAPGLQTRIQRTERMQPGTLGQSLKTTDETIDIVQQKADGVTEEKKTTFTLDSDGRLNTVWVVFGKTQTALGQGEPKTIFNRTR